VQTLSKEGVGNCPADAKGMTLYLYVEECPPQR
jgi:hypothetical protein